MKQNESQSIPSLPLELRNRIMRERSRLMFKDRIKQMKNVLRLRRPRCTHESVGSFIFTDSFHPEKGRLDVHLTFTWEITRNMSTRHPWSGAFDFEIQVDCVRNPQVCEEEYCDVEYFTGYDSDGGSVEDYRCLGRSYSYREKIKKI
jgi:hypothetical protein